MLLILVHEMGHVIALRREGIRASAPMFIPFLGAVISASSLGDDAAAEARVGLPARCSAASAPPSASSSGMLTGNDMWRALAFTGLFLNLFNLLPVVPLDGGRAMAAMAPWMWFLGFAAIIALAILFPNPVILLIALVAGYETYKRWKLRSRAARSSRLTTASSPGSGADRGGVPRADRAAGGRHGRHPPRAHLGSAPTAGLGTIRRPAGRTADACALQGPRRTCTRVVATT